MFRLVLFSMITLVSLGCADDETSSLPDAMPEDARVADGQLDATADAASADAAADASLDAAPDAMGDALVADAAPDGEPMMGCGMRPRPSCCFDPEDCSSGSRCVGASGCMPMGEGVCKSPSELLAGQCWDKNDCEAGARCEGANICPCMARCFAPDVPGSCTADS